MAITTKTTMAPPLLPVPLPLLFSVIMVAHISSLPADGGESGPSQRTLGIKEIWNSILWNRFPEEMFPLLLTDYIQTGRILEGQAKSRVWNLSSEVEVESYSGYLTVNSQYHSHLFFWFCPAETNKTEAPVLLWLNGGPGRTSMVGALLENGPLEVSKDGTQLKQRPVRWTQYFSMLYVDSPVDVGYSFTKDEAGLSTNLKEITDNLYSLLVQFFKLFPQYSHQPFYIGGQSYAGKYVPDLGYHVHLKNTDPSTPAQDHINFRGIYLGAGFCDPANMMPAFPDYLYHAGIISNSQRLEAKDRYHTIITQWPHAKPPKTTEEYLRGFFSSVAKYSSDNLLGYQATNHHLMDGLNKFMTSASARFKLHVGYTAPGPFLLASLDARSKLSQDIMSNTSAENAFLMDRYKVLHYSGNLDVIVNVAMTEAFLAHVQWAGRDQYLRQHRRPWTLDEKLAGWVVVVGNFTRVVIRNSGHMAPYDQPEFTLDMMKRFIFDLPFYDD